MARVARETVDSPSPISQALSDDELLALFRQKYLVPLDPVLASFVEHFRTQFGKGLRAVVFYGSRLSEATRSANSILDFFLFAEDYVGFYPKARDVVLNQVLAPNTYHVRVGSERAKYNVVSLSDFRRETSPRARDLFHAGRFSKRVGLLYARDEATREEMLRLFLGAMKTVVPLAVSRLGAEFTFDEFLYAALAVSYAAEMRVESDSKVASLLKSEEPFYRLVYGALLARYAAESGEIRFDGERRVWSQDQPSLEARRARTERLLRRSKRRMAVRWFKYMATLEGWTDLLLDKIERTKGIRVELTPLQRKYPYIFGWPHFFRFVRKGLAK
jgi:hypothetical protein